MKEFNKYTKALKNIKSIQGTTMSRLEVTGKAEGARE